MNWQSSRRKPPTFKPRDQPGERHLRGVARRREHRFAEEGGAELDAVKAADQRAVLPAFDRMGVAAH